MKIRFLTIKWNEADSEIDISSPIRVLHCECRGPDLVIHYVSRDDTNVIVRNFIHLRKTGQEISTECTHIASVRANPTYLLHVFHSTAREPVVS